MNDWKVREDRSVRRMKRTAVSFYMGGRRENGGSSTYNTARSALSRRCGTKSIDQCFHDPLNYIKPACSRRLELDMPDRAAPLGERQRGRGEPIEVAGGLSPPSPSPLENEQYIYI